MRKEMCVCYLFLNLKVACVRAHGLALSLQDYIFLLSKWPIGKELKGLGVL